MADTQTRSTTQLERFSETLDGMVSYTLEKSIPDGSRSCVTIYSTNQYEVTFIFDQEGELLWIIAEEIE